MTVVGRPRRIPKPADLTSGAAQLVVQLALLIMRESGVTTWSFTPVTRVASRDLRRHRENEALGTCIQMFVKMSSSRNTPELSTA